MVNFKSKSALTLLLLFIYQENSYSGGLVHNVDFRYYIDFANNTGPFKPGASNINIYKKDFEDKSKNVLSNGYVNNGVLKNIVAEGIPMPDFSSVFKFKGTGTLIDPQYTQTNRHTTSRRGAYNTYGSVKHYDAKNIENYVKRIHSGSQGSAYQEAHAADINNDEGFQAFWKDQDDLDISRVSKLITDVAPANLMDYGKEAERYDVNGNRLADSKSVVIANQYSKRNLTYFYRLGGGHQYVNGVSVAGAYRFLTGGVYSNPADGFYPSRVVSRGYARWGISKDGLYTTYDAELGLPIATNGGDSGSPIFGYSKTDKTWYLLGTLLGSDVPPPGKPGHNLYSPLSKSELEYYKKFFMADEIKNKGDGYINWVNGKVMQGNNKWEYKTLTGQDVSTLVNNIDNVKLNNTEDIVFSGDATKIIVDENINSGAGSVTFNNDYVVVGIDDDVYYMGSGLIINDKAKVNWSLKGVEGDSLHKLGTGTLVIDGVGINKGSARIGDGVVFLNQKENEFGEKQSFKDVVLASGRATVVLGDSNQIKGENITFAYRGGTLDLNGNEISFDRIRHVDDGATITNKNANLKSTLNILGGVSWSDNKYKQIYKGFLGERYLVKGGGIDVNFNTNVNDDLLALSGGSNINGDFNINNGSVILTGAPVFYSTLYNDNISKEANELGLNKNYIKDMVEMKTYKVNKFNVANGAKLEFGFSSNTFGDIHASGADIIIGKVVSKKNTVCVDFEGANSPSCFSGNKDVSKFYSSDIIDTFYSGDVYLKNKSNYLIGASIVKGGVFDLDNDSSLTLENGASLTLDGVANNINSLTLNNSEIILGDDTGSNLKINNLVSNDSYFTFDIKAKRDEDALLSINTLIDSNLKFKVNNKIAIDSPFDYTKKIHLASVNNEINSSVALGQGSGDIGLYKFKVSNDNNVNYYLEVEKGLQKDIVSDKTDEVIVSQAAINNVVEEHNFSSLNNFKKNKGNNGLWLSNKLGRNWYSSDESYRDFNQNYNEISFGYGLELHGGHVAVSYSNIYGNTNKSSTTRSNYFDLYGEYYFMDDKNIYFMTSIGENKIKIDSLGKKRKDFTMSYVLGGKWDFYNENDVNAGLYVDMTMSKSNVKNNHGSIKFKNKNNYWLRTGVEVKSTIKTENIKQIDLNYNIGYSHNLSNDDQLVIQNNKFKVEKNKYNIEIGSGLDFKVNDDVTPYVSLGLSIGDKYKPAAQLNMGVRYTF